MWNVIAVVINYLTEGHMFIFVAAKRDRLAHNGDDRKVRTITRPPFAGLLERAQVAVVQKGRMSCARIPTLVNVVCDGCGNEFQQDFGSLRARSHCTEFICPQCHGEFQPFADQLELVRKSFVQLHLRPK
jgi:hypothetical protein